MNNKDMPAYPVFCTNSTQQLYGLTKLEAFTKVALQGLCANNYYTGDKPESIADLAVNIAEATLAELEKKQ